MQLRLLTGASPLLSVSLKRRTVTGGLPDFILPLAWFGVIFFKSGNHSLSHSGRACLPVNAISLSVAFTLFFLASSSSCRIYEKSTFFLLELQIHPWALPSDFSLDFWAASLQNLGTQNRYLHLLCQMSCLSIRQNLCGSISSSIPLFYLWYFSCGMIIAVPPLYSALLVFLVTPF